MPNNSAQDTMKKTEEPYVPQKQTPSRPQTITKAAKPTRTFFDAWNSSSTGHQRADNRLAGSTSWRDSRTRKLRAQFNDTTGGGGARLADTVGAGSEGFGVGGRKENGGWERGAAGMRTNGQQSILESSSGKPREQDVRPPKPSSPIPARPHDVQYPQDSGGALQESRPAKRRRIEASEDPQEVSQSAEQYHHHSPKRISKAHFATGKDSLNSSRRRAPSPPLENQAAPAPSQAQRATPNQNKLSHGSTLTSSASTVTTDAGYSPVTRGPDPSSRQRLDPPDKPVAPAHPTIPKPIFRGLTFYINGSTYPIVSDHKLKQLIGQHGGSLSLGLARRSVTHVIVGELSRNGGAGGGLAGSKIQKEAALGSKGEGVRYVKVAWVVESVKQQKCVSESSYQADMGTGGAKQKSVLGMMKGDRR